MAWGKWWDDKVLESRGLQASHNVGEEVDQPELKTDPEEELEFTENIHYLAITLKVFCLGQGIWLRSLSSKPLWVPENSVKGSVISRQRGELPFVRMYRIQRSDHRWDFATTSMTFHCRYSSLEQKVYYFAGLLINLKVTAST